MGVYDNLAITQSPNTNTFTSNIQTWPVYTKQDMKCKCTNTKHTNGCSIPPENDYCVFCAKGCVKRVQAIHVRYEK